MKYSNYYDESKKYIKEIILECTRRDIAIGDLEKSVDMSPGYISRCKKGKKRMSIDAIKVISNFLGVNFIDRVEGRENYDE